MKTAMKASKFFILIFLFTLFSCEKDDEEEMIDCSQSDLALELGEKVNPMEGSENGSITLNASGGSSPYTFKIGQNSFQDGNTFDGLGAGTYTLTVKDNNDCTATLEVTLEEMQEVSFANDIKPIIDTYCAQSNCHDGSSNLPDFTVFENVQANAQEIKTRTGNGSMPADDDELTDDQIQLIAAWVDQGAKNN